MNSKELEFLKELFKDDPAARLRYNTRLVGIANRAFRLYLRTGKTPLLSDFMPLLIGPIRGKE